MKLLRRLIFGIIGLISMIPSAVMGGQPWTCPALFDQAIELSAEACSGLRRNTACYGHIRLDAVPQPSFAHNFSFQTTGDIVSVSNIQSMALSPMDLDTLEWGITVMQLQANVPNTLPGQNLTFVLFGDTEITTVTDGASGASPMQAFYLRTGIGMAGCEEVPESGLLVQTPKGVGQIEFAFNGMNITLGSTALIQAEPGGVTQVSMLEGAGVLLYDGLRVPVLAGTRVTIPMSHDLTPAGAPLAIESLDSVLMSTLPLRLLPFQDFDPQPMNPNSVAEINRRFQVGEPMCDSGLPDCDTIPWVLGGTSCALNDDLEPTCGLPRLIWGMPDFGDLSYDEASSASRSLASFNRALTEELQNVTIKVQDTSQMTVETADTSVDSTVEVVDTTVTVVDNSVDVVGDNTAAILDGDR